MQAKIAVIDDDEILLQFITGLLSVQAGYEVVGFAEAEAALRTFQSQPDFALVCTDLQLPGIDGFEFIRKLQALESRAPVMVITGSNHLPDALQALRLGAFDYLVKPVDPEQLLLAVARALRVGRLEQDNRNHLAALERLNRRNQQELAMGGALQQQLLPSAFPATAHFRFGHQYLPSNQLGGDFFDLIHYRAADRFGLYLMDVAGHGVPAALLTAFIKSEISQALRDPDRLGPELQGLNRRLCRALPAGRFASGFFVTLDDTTRRLTFCNCGHEPALLVSPDGTIRELDGEGVALGSFDDEFLGPGFTFETGRRELTAGDRLVLYTDGLIEAADETGAPFGPARLRSLIREQRTRPAPDLARELVRTVVAAAGPTGLADDLAVLVVEVTTPAGRNDS